MLGTSEKRQKIHFACSAEYLYAPGRYRIHLILLESLTWMLDDVYEFTVVAQVHHNLAEMFSFFFAQDQGTPQLFSSATVRLSFAPEDTSPPEFSSIIYQHYGISREEHTLVVSMLLFL